MNTTTTTTTKLETDIDRMIPQWTALFKALKPQIDDDYRASDDPDDNTPAMLVTIGYTPAEGETPASWNYQTGDNSYTGGAYGHTHWGVVTLTRRSNSRELANDCADQIANSLCW